MRGAPAPISLTDAFGRLGFLADRVPGQDGDPAAADPPWYANLAAVGDGGVFIVHYAGESEWERHVHGDEFVMVVDGETTMTLLVDGADHRVTLGANEFVVVPSGTWHRFHTPDGVRVLTITPQPTDHRLEHPDEG